MRWAPVFCTRAHEQEVVFLIVIDNVLPLTTIYIESE